MILQIVFYSFAFIACASALAVVLARNPVHSVLSLVITFFAMAAIWMTLEAEFLSLILILVYVGAVMTLFLFVVMMLSIANETEQGGYVKYLPLGMILMIAFTALLLLALNPADLPNTLHLATVDENNTKHLGMLLYTDFAYPFEIAGVLLLAAIIAAISLVHRPPKHRKVQNPAAQIAVKPQNRIRLLSGKDELIVRKDK